MNKITPLTSTAPSAIDFTIAQNRARAGLPVATPPVAEAVPSREAYPLPPGKSFRTLAHQHLVDIRLPDGWIQDHDDERSFSCIWHRQGLYACIDHPDRVPPRRKSLFPRFQLFQLEDINDIGAVIIRTDDFHVFLDAFAKAAKGVRRRDPEEDA